MSTTYKGQAGNITAGSSVAITSSTNATPIVILTAAPHGLTAGDTVDVYNHQTNTAANGQWIVSVVDATHFSLNGSVGNGVGGATGTVDVLAFVSSFTEPSDGDAANAASINTPAQNSADRAAALLVSMGKYKLADFNVFKGDLVALNTSWNVITTAGGGAYALGTHGYDNVFSNVHTGDLLEVDFNVSGYGATNGALYGLTLFANSIAPGAANNFTRIPASGKTWKQTTANQAEAFTLKGYLQIGLGATATGTLQIAIQGASSAGADTITLVDDWTLVAKLWRPTLLATQ